MFSGILLIILVYYLLLFLWEETEEKWDDDALAASYEDGDWEDYLSSETVENIGTAPHLYRDLSKLIMHR